MKATKKFEKKTRTATADRQTAYSLYDRQISLIVFIRCKSTFIQFTNLLEVKVSYKTMRR